MLRYYLPVLAYNIGSLVHIVMRRDHVAHLAESDPIPPPDPDPIPPPPDDPIPPPDPDPIPPPDPDPIPPPDPDPLPYDFPVFPGPLVLLNAKGAFSQGGRFWILVDEDMLDTWEIQDERHLDMTLNTKITERRAGVVFCLSAQSRWWAFINEYVVSRGWPIPDVQ